MFYTLPFNGKFSELNEAFSDGLDSFFQILSHSVFVLAGEF